MKTKIQTRTAEEVALTYFQSQHYPKGCNPPLEAIKDVILRLALAHPKQVSEWIGKAVSYQDAEGFDDAVKINSLMNARILEQPEYKAIRRKLKGGVR